MSRYIREVVLSKKLPTDTYLNNIPAIRFLNSNKKVHFNKDVTFFVGENGTGKSTLLEAIAVAYGFNPEGGTRNFNFSTKSSHSDLHEYLTIVKSAYASDGFFLRAESLYNVATYIEALSEAGLGTPIVESYGGVSLHEQSHGESFISIVQNRFGGNGLYILDEPEAALSPMRLMSLMTAIDMLVKNKSQFIIATHSPILMSFPNSQVLQFNESGITEVNYKDTEHFQVTKRFLECPEKMFHYLLEEL